ncbi:MAG: hypothetical protein ACKN9T_06930 [Candidatus Methylumidiphilus sp.]
MIEPVELKDFFTAFFAAAAVILCGAGYAGLYAWSKLRGRPALLLGACACYAVLVAATLLLAQATHLQGEWQVLVGLMLIGYLLAPLGIWRLCVGSHGG